MVNFRFKCVSCGAVYDRAQNVACPECGSPQPVIQGGYVQIYRMGSPLGMGAGYGMYINGVPYGHIANKQSVRVLLPYGTYTFHFTCGMTRRCEDVTVAITPENREIFVKAHIVAGFWTNKIVAEVVDRSQMPE